MKKLKILYLLFLLLSGCKVGPNYEKPNIPMPEKYSQSAASIQQEMNLDNWWKNFNDENLNELINIAIENNYDLKIALEKIEEARNFYRIEKANLWPEIDLNAQVIRQRISQNIFGSKFLGPSIQNFYQIGFDAIWELDFFGKLRRSKEAAYYEIQSQQENMRDVYITLLSEVARTYIDVLAIGHKIKIKEKKIKHQSDIFSLLTDKFSAGLSNQINPEQEYKTLKQDEIDLIDLNISLKKNIYRLAHLLGKYPEDFEKEFNYDKKLPIATDLVTVGIPSDLLKRRPDIRKAERELATATATIGVAIAELFPSFSLTADFNYESSKSNRWFRWASRAWSIGPNVNLPLIDFGRRLANIDVKKSQHKQALFNYENIIILALEDVENSFVSYFHQEDNFSLKQEQLSSQTTITDLVNDLYESGLNNNIQYLESKINLIDIQNEYIDTIRNLNISYISVIKALGGGWESCLKQP